MTADEDRPVVTTDPAVRFGRPAVRGVSVVAVASQVWGGETVGSVAEDFGLTREQVIVACWYQGIHGTRGWRQRWKVWATEAHKELWRSRYDVPDPPSREEKSNGSS